VSVEEGGARGDRNPWRLAVVAPLLLFLGLSGLFLYALFAGDPSKVPSALIGRPAPEFSLPPLEGLVRENAPVPGFARADIAQGQPTIVNVFASWCVPCRAEHPLLERLAAQRDTRLYGVNYKDEPGAALRFLGALGNPYGAVGIDRDGRAAIDWGVYGVPETFVVDGQGDIVFKHVGPLTEDSIRDELMPALERARGRAPAG
jgi:cytochrome c biogenesis protein CcmG/thiol:disulfide interchange protein DsbE